MKKIEKFARLMSSIAQKKIIKNKRIKKNEKNCIKIGPEMCFYGFQNEVFISILFPLEIAFPRLTKFQLNLLTCTVLVMASSPTTTMEWFHPLTDRACIRLFIKLDATILAAVPLKGGEVRAAST